MVLFGQQCCCPSSAKLPWTSQLGSPPSAPIVVEPKTKGSPVTCSLQACSTQSSAVRVDHGAGPCFPVQAEHLPVRERSARDSDGTRGCQRRRCRRCVAKGRKVAAQFSWLPFYRQAKVGRGRVHGPNSIGCPLAPRAVSSSLGRDVDPASSKFSSSRLKHAYIPKTNNRVNTLKTHEEDVKGQSPGQVKRKSATMGVS